MSIDTSPKAHATDPLLRSPTEDARWILTLGDVARYCGVPHEEVLTWIDKGMLKATFTPPMRYRVAVKDFLVFVEKFDVLD